MIWWCVQQFCGCWRRLSIGKRLESGGPGADSGVGGDPCVPNEKSTKLDLCSLVEGLPVRPLAIRCGVCAGQLPFDTPRGQGAPSIVEVRENRALGSPFGQPGRTARERLAPSGALRHHVVSVEPLLFVSQGAPSTTRCIEVPFRV